MWKRSTLAVTVLSFVAVGCGGSPTEPTRNTVAISATSPASGTTITLSQFPYFELGGLVIPPGSGVLSATISLSVANHVPWAQLSVYLLTGGTTDSYCGQNTPDAPTWQFVRPGWTNTVTVTGFRAVLPCDVTGIRAILHMRNNGSLIPATGSDVIAEAVTPTRLHLRR